MDRVPAANELSFRVGFTGHSGHLAIEPLPPVERLSPLQGLPDFILPPAFPKETPETIKEYIKEKHLQLGLDEDVFSPQNSGRQWDFDWFDRAEIQLEPSMPRSVVVPSWEMPCRRKARQSELERWEPESVEVDVSEMMIGAEDSGALPRIVGPAKDFVRGSLKNRPFRPGGLDNADSLGKIFPEGACNGEWARELLHGGPAQVRPPGFKDGLDLGDLKAHSCTWNVYEKASAEKSTSDVKLNELSVQFDDLFKKAWDDDVLKFVGDDHMPASETPTESVTESLRTESEEENLHAVDDVIKKESSILDEILSVESAESTPRLDGDANGGGQRPKEGWAFSGGSEQITERFHELVPDMALNFPFELDPFQKEAIVYLERGESVFVAAHTSAGKTVVAEYAFALASKHCTRAVYTAPIKTISNQKYRDFCGKFDVGLLTGDVSLRPEASCLIMTTEILRSMLYRGADIIRDIEWVIFDEVHYVNDVERGVVWEEVIIMLPRHINFVLLSATVPNTVEFADWIGRTKQKQIRVTGTTKRPVPLEHCLFYSGELYKICENEKIIPQGLKAAKDVYKKKNSATVTGTASYSGSSAANERARTQRRENSTHVKQNKHSVSQNMVNFTGGNWGTQSSGSNNWSSRRSEASIWLSLINKLSKKSLLPVVIFCFSKNRCDKSADNLPGTDLTTSSEKSEIRVFCDKAFSRLKGSDRNLPQVVRVQALLRRGIGVHHAGLLPIVKEVVEMLFCRGVVKILFSTETFAMGVNAPARTVVFDSLRKFDGKEFRQLLPGEYTQMAGRAGRRGLDKIGTVVVLCRDEIPEEKDLKHVIVGSATRLESQFRLTYIMILHLLRVEELKVEDMLKRSFAEFHAQKKLPEQQQLLMRKLAQPTKVVECIKGEPAIEDYYEMYSEAESYSKMITEAIMLSQVSQQYLTPGRVVVVKSQLAQDHLLGVILKTPSANYKQYIVLVLTPELPSILNTPSDDRESKGVGFQVLVPKSKRGWEDDYYSSGMSRKGSGIVNIKLPHRGFAAGVNYEVRGVENNEFLSICHNKIKIDQVRLLEDVSAGAYSNTVQQLLTLKSDGNKYPPALDPVKDLKVKDMKVVEVYYKWTNLLHKMAQSKCHGCVKLDENIKVARELKRHKEEVNALKFQMSDEALQQMPDFQGRIDVLKEIGCIDADLVVQIKGRVACEMNSGEELICTECLFENQLNDLEPEEAVAIMSAFVFQQKNTSEPSLTPKLSQAKKRLYDTAIRLGELQADFKLQVDPEEYAQENLKFGLVQVVYEWAKGTPFADICELTDVPEGMIVRTIVRLDETCREFRNAAAIMGNSALYKKMEIASNAIKRDVVFAASLYITGV
ncbi:Cytoplasmic exosomal RNA helicase SKI2, DEAD-box superfamily [Handroanthus impetiginosus]|uniref:Cytoplasmic exosomal RNA helicase SKI2, DEAD-box superfamily n=1 Tax=Handroanthus impetiginosus TaxID=429701 RepID=A0A2G9GHD6_9LAMI|nr:Cytoplasmic exosomal RNA helicase SKI2, DEAD-box superfamily [Handroanthus impetiginosus]